MSKRRVPEEKKSRPDYLGNKRKNLKNNKRPRKKRRKLNREELEASQSRLIICFNKN